MFVLFSNQLLAVLKIAFCIYKCGVRLTTHIFTTSHNSIAAVAN